MTLRAYQGVRNVKFSENFAYLLNEWSFIESCLISDSSQRKKKMNDYGERYTNADLKTSLDVCVYIKTIPWKFCILNPRNSRVICPWSL